MRRSLLGVRLDPLRRAPMTGLTTYAVGDLKLLAALLGRCVIRMAVETDRLRVGIGEAEVARDALRLIR